MNSISKQEIPASSPTDHETYVLDFERRLLSMKDVSEVEMMMKKLQFLGIHFNPFEEVASSECQEVMNSLEMTPHLRNPYLATNILLRLLDKTEEQLNKLKQ